MEISKKGPCVKHRVVLERKIFLANQKIEMIRANRDQAIAKIHTEIRDLEAKVQDIEFPHQDPAPQSGG